MTLLLTGTITHAGRELAAGDPVPDGADHQRLIRLGLASEGEPAEPDTSALDDLADDELDAVEALIDDTSDEELRQMARDARLDDSGSPADVGVRILRQWHANVAQLESGKTERDDEPVALEGLDKPALLEVADAEGVDVDKRWGEQKIAAAITAKRQAD